jgi:hypothetical protein
MKVFGKARKELSAQNKISQYLRYAIGEIILVMLGILLALQVNNWNADRKDAQLEEKLLSELAISLRQDSSNLNSERAIYEGILLHAQILKNTFKYELPYVDSLSRSFAMVSVFTVIEADYTIFENIKAAGLSLIKNDSLRNKMIQYYNLSNYVAGVERYFENGKYFRQQIYPKYFNSYQYGVLAIPNDFETIKHSSEFNIALDYCINDAYFYLNWSAVRKQQCLELISMINSQLN